MRERIEELSLKSSLPHYNFLEKCFLLDPAKRISINQAYNSVYVLPC